MGCLSCPDPLAIPINQSGNQYVEAQCLCDVTWCYEWDLGKLRELPQVIRVHKQADDGMYNIMIFVQGQLNTSKLEHLKKFFEAVNQ